MVKAPVVYETWDIPNTGRPIAVEKCGSIAPRRNWGRTCRIRAVRPATTRVVGLRSCTNNRLSYRGQSGPWIDSMVDNERVVCKYQPWKSALVV